MLPGRKPVSHWTDKNGFLPHDRLQQAEREEACRSADKKSASRQGRRLNRQGKA